ncbi:hypothetical protein NN6n1_09840 [Shinella zoogloeoides]
MTHPSCCRAGEIAKPLNLLAWLLCFKTGTLSALLWEGPEGTNGSAGKRRSDKAAAPLQRNTNVSGRPGGFFVFGVAGCHVPEARAYPIFLPQRLPPIGFLERLRHTLSGMVNA